MASCTSTPTEKPEATPEPVKTSGIPLPSGPYTSPTNGRTYDLLYADDFATDPFSRPTWNEKWISSSSKRADLLANKYNIWLTYDGGPSTAHEETSWWRSKNVTHTPGALVLGSSWDAKANSDREYPGQVGRLSTSGLSAGFLANTVKYGRWDVVWRMDTSEDVMYAIMLYGDSGAYWPLYVEIDIAEGNGDGQNDAFFTTLHYEGGEQGHEQRRLIGDVKTTNDYSNWHRLSVDFSPNRLDYYLDGTRVVSAVTASSAGVEESGDCPDLIKQRKLPDNICYVADGAIPDSLTYHGRDLGPRTFIFQTETATEATPSTPAPTADIDWVAIYRLRE